MLFTKSFTELKDINFLGQLKIGYKCDVQCGLYSVLPDDKLYDILLVKSHGLERRLQ